VHTSSTAEETSCKEVKLVYFGRKTELKDWKRRQNKKIHWHCSA